MDFFFSMLSVGAVLLCLALTFVLLMLKRFVHGRPDALLVVMGAVGNDRKAKILHGGISFVWPVIQSWAWLPLKPITVSLKLTGALSQENIRVNVPCTFIVAVDSENRANMETAAIRLLDVINDERAFASFAEDIIFGQMRSVIASMKVSDINNDRQGFQDRITSNVSSELSKVGLKLITVNIQDITDEANYIANLGKKAEAEAKAEADIAIAEENNRGESGRTRADAERRKNVSANNLLAIQAENENKAAEAESTATLDRKLRETQAKNDSQATISVSNAEKEAEVARAENLKAVYAAQEAAAKAEEAKEVARMRVEAVAAAEKRVIDARAEGEAEGKKIFQKMAGEAEGALKIFEAKAEGIRKVIDACGGNPQAAVMLLMSDQLPSIMSEYAKMAATRKIDKLVCIDSNGGDALSSLTRSFMSAVPQLTEMLEAFGLKTEKKHECACQTPADKTPADNPYPLPDFPPTSVDNPYPLPDFPPVAKHHKGKIDKRGEKA